jgi:putative aldouronate transport system substrate-binding protein
MPVIKYMEVFMIKQKMVLGSLKGLLAAALVLFVCGTVFAGGQRNTTSSGKVKLTALINKHALTKDLNEMKWLREVSDKVGVEIEWTQVSADWDQKKAPMLASGDVPDLFIGNWTIGDADFATYQGLFVDLKPLIDKHAPNIQRMFREVPQTLVLATQTNGAIYGIPRYQRFWPKTNGTMFINKVWLDKLGLKAPTNWDELYDVLVAFRDNDVNGNGDKNDEYPMDFCGWGGAYNPMMLLGATGLQITNWGNGGYFAENGVVKNYYTDPRYKELIQFIHKCFAANLINPEALTQDYSVFQSIARGEGSTAKVGFTWGWESGDRFGNTLASQYISLPPLKTSARSNIDPRWMYDFYGLNMGPNNAVITAKCKNQEMAIKFIDAFYDPEVSLQVLFGGITDGCIAKNADGSYTILPPADPAYDPGTWKWMNSMADIGPIFLSDSMKVTLGSDMQIVTKEKSVYEHAFTLIDQKKDVLPVDFFKPSTDENNTLSMNSVNYGNIHSAKVAQWITQGGIESEWDQYVRDLRASGIDENVKIMQKYYDIYVKGLK